LDLEKKLNKATGKTEVMEGIANENDTLVKKMMVEVGLTDSEQTAGKVYEALTKRIIQVDSALFEFVGKPDLFEMSSDGGSPSQGSGMATKLCDVAFELSGARRGYFIKKEKLQQMLEAFPPQNLLEHFQCQTVAELVEKEGLTTIFCALRFAQDNQWMHDFFDKAYNKLTADDFEERDIEIKILEKKWLEIAQKFTKHKYHNVSHLKEMGVIFVVPVDLAPAGETVRLFLLLLHYLNEVPYYSGLFKKLIVADSPTGEFVANFQSLLRGDVLDGALPSENAIRIVQRYLAKDDPNDFRLLEPHVDPEAEHWYKAGSDFTKLKQYFTDKAHLFEGWEELHFVGAMFPSQEGDSSTVSPRPELETKAEQEKLVSFDIVDLAMDLASQSDIKYIYHQQEALWNQIFIEYLGRDKMNRLIEENLLKGYIEL